VGTSKANLGKVVRAAVVTGLLGAAGLTFSASPALGQQPSPSASPSPSPTPDDTAPDDTTTPTTAFDSGTSPNALASTGGDVAVPLTFGGLALGIVLFGRRLVGSGS
jgi:hypothetical protein